MRLATIKHSLVCHGHVMAPTHYLFTPFFWPCDLLVQAAKQAMRRLLAPDGLYLNLTMFIPESKRIFSSDRQRCLMCELEYTQHRKSRSGRPTVKTQWAAVYIVASSPETFNSLNGRVLAMGTYTLPLQDARKVPSYALKPGAGFY